MAGRGHIGWRLVALLSGAVVALACAPAAPAAEEEPRVVWGGSAKTRAELADWLATRGITYGAWAERHPEAAARFRGEVLPPPQSESEVELTAPEETAPPIFAQGDPAPAAGGAPRPRASNPLLGGGAALALLLALAASGGLAVTALRVPGRQRELVALAACIPVSVALGILVARLGGL